MNNVIVFSQIINIFVVAFLGGIFGAWFFDNFIDKTADLINTKPAHTKTSNNVHNYYNGFKNRTVFIGSHENNGGLFLFDENGGLRAQMGSYSVGNEKGQSLFGLNDRKENLRLLNRLYGPNDVPTVILKDSNGQDQIVFGLDAVSEEPYFHYRHHDGSMKNLITDSE